MPLGFVHEKTRLFRKDGARPGSTRRENLAVHALARVLFNGFIRNIQVSWVKMGFEESLACLEAGANDFSGTLMEEHISKSAGANFGEYVSPEQFRALIRRIGRIPAERTTTYELRHVYSAKRRWRYNRTRFENSAAAQSSRRTSLRGNGLLMEIVALAGGVGASKLLVGLAHAMAPENLTIIVNTGDDLEMHGLTICPDLDIVTYTLAGIVNPATGWGIDGDTFATLQFLGRYERETWFNLGDRDLATHIHRSDMLRGGATLSECTDSIRRALGVRAHILPMSDQPVRTQIETPAGLLPFQNYLVKHRAEPMVKAIRFDGADRSEPAPGVLRAIADARGIVICPSNPLISIGPILAVPGIRKALAARRADVVAVCPIVDGMSLKGPTRENDGRAGD